MPDATPSPLDAALERANRLRNDAQGFRLCADTAASVDEQRTFLDDAFNADIEADAIMSAMKEGNGHG